MNSTRSYNFLDSYQLVTPVRNRIFRTLFLFLVQSFPDISTYQKNSESLVDFQRNLVLLKWEHRSFVVWFCILQAGNKIWDLIDNSTP